MITRRIRIALVGFLVTACGAIDDNPAATTDGDAAYQPSYLEKTAAFGFEIGVPPDLVEEGWLAKDPSFLTGQASDGFQQLVVNRVFGIQVDAPPGGEHLLNNNNEFGANPRATRLVVYVYERQADLTIEALSDSVRGVAYDAFDDRINGQDAKTLTYKGLNAPRRARNASESLLPQHIFEGSRYFYFILYWDTDPEIRQNVLRVLDTFRITDRTG